VPFQLPGTGRPPNLPNVSTFQSTPDADEPDLFRETYAGDNILQSYEICVPEAHLSLPVLTLEQKYWVIFIHGGAWRDPLLNAGCFALARDVLLTSPWHERAIASIAGYQA
jgi:hypothetical protein